MFEVLTIFKAEAKNIIATAHGDHHTMSSCHRGRQPKLLPRLTPEIHCPHLGQGSLSTFSSIPQGSMG